MRSGVIGVLCVVLVLAGCASGGQRSLPEPELRVRAERMVADEVIVDVAALGDAESRREFGVDLATLDVQPLRIRVVNGRDGPLWVMPLAIDPDYWSPMEVAWRAAGAKAAEALDARAVFLDRALPVMIDANSADEGFVYTHPDEGLKAVRVQLLGLGWSSVVTTVVRVPGTGRSRDLQVASTPLSAPSAPLSALQAWLADQPCCTQNAAAATGDPLNIAFVGSGAEVVKALVDTHWDVVMDEDAATRGRLVRAFLSGERERYAPVSPLFLYGRRADLSFQKARDVVDQRNHLRLWRAPLRVGGRELWIGQISRDVGVKLTFRHWPPVTHVIDPAVDEARFYLMQNLLIGGHLAEIGFAEGVPEATADRPAVNAEGDPYLTDGLRAIFVLSPTPVARGDTRIMDGEMPGRTGERLVRHGVPVSR